MMIYFVNKFVYCFWIPRTHIHLKEFLEKTNFKEGEDKFVGETHIAERFKGLAHITNRFIEFMILIPMDGIIYLLIVCKKCTTYSKDSPEAECVFGVYPCWRGVNIFKI